MTLICITKDNTPQHHVWVLVNPMDLNTQDFKIQTNVGAEIHMAHMELDLKKNATFPVKSININPIIIILI